MPRQSRIDAPGALHHVIIRGIERKAIFKDTRWPTILTLPLTKLYTPGRYPGIVRARSVLC